MKEGFFTKIKWLLAAVLSLMMLLPVCISAEEAYPWQTGLCTEPCHVSDGPDETCLPKLDGPKAVLTPDMPVRVFGEEDGCLFIQYKVSDTCMPFGYVPKDALQVEALALDFTFKSAYTLMVNDRLPVTDDPMGEAEGLEFPIELDVYALFELDDWVYIENYHSGGDERFFVKRENMGYGRRFPLEGYTNEFMHGALIISSDSTYTIDAACDPIVIDGVKWPDAQSLAVLDEDENVIVRVERGEDGYFRSAGDWNSDAIDLEFLMLDENGNELQTVGEAG